MKRLRSIAAVRASELRDFPEWHQGRPQYALWAVLPQSPALEHRIALARTGLRDILLPDYHRAAHVTVEVCGFPSGQARNPDDFDQARLAAQLGALSKARVAPFELSIGGLDSFATAPYLEVGDDGSLARLRAAMGDRGISGDGFEFVPHITLGLYGVAASRGELLERFAAMPFDDLRVPVRRLHLLGYAPAVIGGTLTVLATWDLADNLLIPSTDFPFETP